MARFYVWLAGAIMLSTVGIVWADRGCSQTITKVAREEDCRPQGASGGCVMVGTSCYIILLMCSHCCYDERGGFRKLDTRPCGLCFGFEW